MITVEIQVSGHVKELMPDKKDHYRVQLSGPRTVSEILRDEVGVNPLLFAIVVVNGERKPKDYLIQEDSKVVLVSPVAGG